MSVARQSSLLVRSVGYEFRKRTQFRTGFIVREVLRGVVEPLAMLFVYTALYRSATDAGGDAPGDVTLGGWSYSEIIKYVAGLMVVRKIVFDSRGLEVATEIFEGRVTKYLVMPFQFFVLIQARFVQYTTLQVVVAALVWCVGFGVMGHDWLVPVSGVAALQGFTLVVAGSYCCFLLYFILSALAFWLDVVWSLVVMAWFVVAFTGGALLPVSQMPDALARSFSFAFPYWTITAPIEIFMGRLGTDAFVRGSIILVIQLVALDLLRRFVWNRGIRQYVAAGM